MVRSPDPRTDRLYFGKALIYPIVAAPFVRAFGLNGLLLLNVVLLAVAALCAYLFLAARSSPVGAALFTTAFFGASAVPVVSRVLDARDSQRDPCHDGVFSVDVPGRSPLAHDYRAHGRW